MDEYEKTPAVVHHAVAALILAFAAMVFALAHHVYRWTINEGIESQQRVAREVERAKDLKDILGRGKI